MHLSFVCSLKHGDIWILWATEGILLLGDKLEFWISRHNDDDEGVWHKLLFWIYRHLICLPNIFFLLPMYVFILHLIYFNVILIDVVKMYYHLNFPAFSWPEDSMAHPSSSVLYIIASSYGIYRSIFLGQNQHVYT